MAICFADNDIILKLAACNLFDEVLTSFDLTKDDVRVLPTAIFKFNKNNTKLAKIYTEVGVQRGIEIVSNCARIEQSPTSTEFGVLNDLEGIDAGEALLFATTKTVNDFYILTGDKKCLRALASSNLAEIKQRHSRRVFCFEQVILKVIKTCGFEAVKEKIVPVRECDTALKAAFGSGQKSTAENTILSLQDYVHQLRALTQELLMDE